MGCGQSKETRTIIEPKQVANPPQKPLQQERSNPTPPQTQTQNQSEPKSQQKSQPQSQSPPISGAANLSRDLKHLDPKMATEEMYFLVTDTNFGAICYLTEEKFDETMIICNKNDPIIQFSETVNESLKQGDRKKQVYLPKYAMITLYQNQIFMMGGSLRIGEEDEREDLNYNYVMNPPDFKLQPKSPMKEEKSSSGVCAFDNKIIIVGGLALLQPLSTAEVYSIPEDKWQDLPKLSSPKSNLTLCPFKVNQETKIYAIGGRMKNIDGDWEKLNSIEVLNYGGDIQIWENIRVQNLELEAISFGAIQLNDEEILLFGGENDNERQIDKSQIFNPVKRRMENPDPSLALKSPASFSCISLGNHYDNQLFAWGDESNIHVFKNGRWDIIENPEQIHQIA